MRTGARLYRPACASRDRGSLRLRFARPVVVPDNDEGVTVTASGTVTELRGDGLVGVDVTVRVGQEKVLTQARALVRPPNHG